MRLVLYKGSSLGWPLLTQVGQQSVPGVWLGEGLLSPVPKPNMKLRRIMGYKASIWLRHPQFQEALAPQVTPSPTKTTSRRDGEASSDTKPYLYIYLYTCIYFRRKEQFRGQGANRPRAASPCPLLSPSGCTINMSRSSGMGAGRERGGRGAVCTRGLLQETQWGQGSCALRGPMYSLKLGGD